MNVSSFLFENEKAFKKYEKKLRFRRKVFLNT